jgi:hypothetical protein
MPRQKKIKTIMSKEKPEVIMLDKVSEQITNPSEITFEEVINISDAKALSPEMSEVERLRIEIAEMKREKELTEIDKLRLEVETMKKQLEQKNGSPKFITSREIDEEELLIVKKQLTTQSRNSAGQEIIAKQKAHDNEMVTGKFINRRAPGKMEKLTYLKHADDPVGWKEFYDGQVYTIKRGFADQINGGDDNNPCYYTPQFVQKSGELVPSDKIGENSQVSEVLTHNKKFAFVPLSY